MVRLHRVQGYQYDAHDSNRRYSNSNATATCKVTVKENKKFVDIAKDLKIKIANANVSYKETSFNFEKSTPVKRRNCRLFFIC